MTVNVTESVEMYLETIFVLTGRNADVRSIDISREMNFSKPSVSRAIASLKKQGLIAVSESGVITLTPSGEEIASRIYERHVFLSEGLMALGVSEATAIKDACRVEHYISDETFTALKNHLSKLRNAKKSK